MVVESSKPQATSNKLDNCAQWDYKGCRKKEIYMETKIADTIMPSGYTFQQVMLLNALRRQAKTGMLMTNPRVTGYTSFAKAVLAFINDPKAPKTCKKLYEYLVKNGYYEGLDVHLA